MQRFTSWSTVHFFKTMILTPAHCACNIAVIIFWRHMILVKGMCLNEKKNINRKKSNRNIAIVLLSYVPCVHNCQQNLIGASSLALIFLKGAKSGSKEKLEWPQLMESININQKPSFDQEFWFIY